MTWGISANGSATGFSSDPATQAYEDQVREIWTDATKRVDSLTGGSFSSSSYWDYSGQHALLQEVRDAAAAATARKSKFLVTQTVDRQALDRDAKSELVEIGEVVELSDAGTIEKFVGNGTLEPLNDPADLMEAPPPGGDVFAIAPEPPIREATEAEIREATEPVATHAADGAVNTDVLTPAPETKEVQQQSPEADPSGTSAE